jgi:hypothetical protein
MTPVGILAVNASAFVMLHLDQFRIGIAACAVISGLVLNGLTAWWLLRLANRNAPPLFREYRTWAIGVAVLIVLLTAAGGGYLTYLGLKDPRRLPDSLSIVVATFALVLPFAVTYAGRRMAGLSGLIPIDEPGHKQKKSPSPKQGALKTRG